MVLTNCAKCNREFSQPRLTLGAKYCSSECWYGRNREMGELAVLAPLECAACGKVFTRQRSVNPKGKRKFCSNECRYSHNIGSAHGSWRGGRFTHRGYTFISTMPNKSRREHLVIAENALGRRLKKGECVHHINGNKSDNRNSNLLICTLKYHAELHQRMGLLYAQMMFGEKI